MKTIYLKTSTACLLFLAYLAIASICFAAHEVTSYYPDFAASATARQQTTDFDVSWDEPDMGENALIGYAYLWNESETALTHTTYSAGNYTGFNNAGVEIVTLTANEIASDDSDMLRYLHIQTVYNTGSLSNDVVIGPFNFDNVCTGTFRLPDPDNQDNDLSATRDTTVDIEVGAPVDISSTGLYLNEIDTIPASGSDPTTTTYSLNDTTPGDKTIYAWFEDEVGNISSPFPASFTLLDPVSIDPYTATIDLGVIDTQDFSVAGTTAGYDWTITNETPEEQGNDVAQITTSATNMNTITVQALDRGTFTLSATPNGGGTAIESGTITVSGTSANLDVDGSGTATALGDGILIVRYLVGFTGTTLINGVVDTQNCTRCSSTDIESYLLGAKDAILDVDGSGTATALGDGVLIVRYLVGFTGTTLTNGVVDTQNCTRCNSTDIEAYLAPLKP